MTLLSRITGMLQSRLVASVLGAGLAADAFMVAFRIPNLLRRFTAEGTMTAAFLPTVSEVEATQGEAAGTGDGGEVPGHPGLALTLLCLLAIPLMGAFTGLQMLGKLAPEVRWWQQLGVLGEVLAGTRPAPAQWALTTTLARIMFPYLALVSLTAGLAAVLNLRGRFGLPASVSTFWNLAFIGFAWPACTGAPGPGGPRNGPRWSWPRPPWWAGWCSCSSSGRRSAGWASASAGGPGPAPPGGAQRPEAHGPGPGAPASTPSTWSSPPSSPPSWRWGPRPCCSTPT